MLVTVSCFTHAWWNLLAKRAAHRADFLWWMILTMGVALAGPGVAGLVVFPLPAECLAWSVASGAFLGLYFTSLTMAYRNGDLSIVYPLARGGPIFMVTCAGIILGERYNVIGYAGLAIVLAGVLILPLRAGVGWRRWLNRGSLWALLTAVATSGYSLFDRAAMKAVHELGGGTLALGARSLSYEWLQFSVGMVVMALLAWPFSARPKRQTWRLHRRPIVTVAILNALGYALVLLAMQTNKVAYVIAFRQLSIILTVVLGVSLLHERRGMGHRLFGAAAIAAGLILVALAK